MNKNFVAAITLVIIVAAAVVLAVISREVRDTDPRSTQRAATEESSLLPPTIRVGDRDVALPDYDKERVVNVAFVELAEPGYIVIRDDLFGQPGIIVGTSELLLSGESRDISIRLSQPINPEAAHYAILHVDDGDGRFRQLDDPPLTDVNGNAVTVAFTLGGDARRDIRF